MHKLQIFALLPLVVGTATGLAWAQGGPPADNAPANAYVIGPQDVIYAKVFRNADFSRAYVVRADGTIVLPLVGPVQAAGQTTQNLAARIREVLSVYIKDPEVTVMVLRVAAKPTPPAK
jgi:polysaccharide biosynthesis/export protein